MLHAGYDQFVRQASADDHARHPSVANHSRRDWVADHHQDDPKDADDRHQDGQSADHDRPPVDQRDADGLPRNAHAADHHRADQSDVRDRLLAAPRAADDLPRVDRPDVDHRLGDPLGDHDRLQVDLRGADDRLLDERRDDDHRLPGDLLADQPGVDDRLQGGSDARRQNRPEDRGVVWNLDDLRDLQYSVVHYSVEQVHQVEQGDLRRRRGIWGDLPVLVGQRAWP